VVSLAATSLHSNSPIFIVIYLLILPRFSLENSVADLSLSAIDLGDSDNPQMVNSISQSLSPRARCSVMHEPGATLQTPFGYLF
jgi:hypothetical protein